MSNDVLDSSGVLALHRRSQARLPRNLIPSMKSLKLRKIRHTIAGDGLKKTNQLAESIQTISNEIIKVIEDIKLSSCSHRRSCKNHEQLSLLASDLSGNLKV